VGENIVVNLSMFNPFDAPAPIPAVLDVALEKPILDKCSNYKMTILRFHCPLYSIRPNYIIKGQEFVVRLFDDALYYQASTNVGQIGQSIHEFISTINSLFKTVWNNYSTSHPNNGTSYGQPFLTHDPVTDLFSLIVPCYFYFGAYKLDVQVNPTLFYYIAGIPATQLPDGFYSFMTSIELRPDRDIEDRYYFSKYYNNAVLKTPLTTLGNAPTKFDALRFQAEFSTSYRFNDFQSVLVLSNIPIRQETIPQATGQLSAFLPNKLSYIATLPVVSDFHAGIARYGDQNSDLLYFPPGEYRWIDLISDGPLDRLSFDFRYQLIDQSVHQIMLNPGDSVSLKIYFRSIYK
jgi:hypothetical protein